MCTVIKPQNEAVETLKDVDIRFQNSIATLGVAFDNLAYSVRGLILKSLRKDGE